MIAAGSVWFSVWAGADGAKQWATPCAVRSPTCCAQTGKGSLFTFKTVGGPSFPKELSSFPTKTESQLRADEASPCSHNSSDCKSFEFSACRCTHALSLQTLPLAPSPFLCCSRLQPGRARRVASSKHGVENQKVPVAHP
jgi:hypothetical protein